MDYTSIIEYLAIVNIALCCIILLF